MPKVTWLKSAKPKVNHLSGLFYAYRQSTGLSSAEIGKRVGCSASNARGQMIKPAESWNVGQLLRYCDALGIPYEDAIRAAAQK